MNNFIKPGNVLTFIAPAGGVTSGTGYVIGSLFVVATNTVAATHEFEGQCAGVFDLAKATGQAWAEGDRIYWDATAVNATTAAAGNVEIGIAEDVIGSAVATGRVRLNGTPDPGGTGSAANTATHAHDDSSPVTILAASAVARTLLWDYEVTETLAGTTTTPQFQLGYTGLLGTFFDFNTGTAGDTDFGSGTLPAGEALLLTITDGTGGGEAGEVKLRAQAADA